MDKETLYESLTVWLETFSLDSPHQSPEQLSDGIAMAKVLHQIAPDYFNESWLSKIKTEDVTNWRLKVSNLKKILKGILEYNLEVLGIQIHDFQMPDVNAIGEHSDHGELGRLLQLILGCAVNCTEKQEYIQRIMAMEESVQHVVMTAIQELMTKEITTDMDSEVGEQLKRTVEELNSAIEAKEELMQRCHELDLQVTALVEEKQNLSLENEKLSERLNQAENLDDPSTPAGKRFQMIQHQLEQCQEENYKLEAGKDDFRIKIDVLQKEVNDLKDKNSELSTQADECRGLKDELDDLRQAAELVVKYEVQIESYKKKMDELSDLRGQVKLLEDKNTKYMQENLELQEDIRKSGAVKQQLDVYKRQVHELQSKLTEETKRADKADFENKRMNEKVSTLMREKERVMIERDSLRELNEELRCRPVEHRIVTERDSLREVNEELKCTQSQHVGAGAGDDLSTTSQMEMLSLPPEVKEKILRLEHENKMLKLKSSGDSDEQAQVLQTMLDDANSRKNELETEIRLANQKNMELEAQIEDLQEMAKSTVSNSEMVELRKKLDEQVHLTQQKDKLIQKERDSVLDVQKELTAQNEEVEKLRDKIEKKEEEKRVMEERYKKYFDKARSVINSLEAKSKSGNNYQDVQALKQQIQEKDKLIEQLQKDQEKSKNTFEQEEKMMVSAWYNLGIQLHRQAAIDRLENSQPGQAFLSRQRQAHLRGQPRIPNSHSNPSSDLDLTPTSGQSANQNSSSGDGCFASLFDCLLMKLREEVVSKEELESLNAAQEIRPAVLHSQLLSGLLGENQKATGSVTSEQDLEEDFVEVPDTPEVDKKSYRSLKLDRSRIPLLSHSLSSLVTPLKSVGNEFVDEGHFIDAFAAEPHASVDETKICMKQSDQLGSPESDAFFDDKDNTVNAITGEDGHAKAVSLKLGAEIIEVSTDAVHLNNADAHDKVTPRKIESDSVEVCADVACVNNSTGMENSFFEELEEFSAVENDKQDVSDLIKFEDVIQNAEKGLESGNRPGDITELLADDSENKEHLVKTHRRGVTEPLRTRDKQPYTPVRNRNENIPTHLQSPFVKKIPTDRVTKRRARRKRKIEIKDTDKENEECKMMYDRAKTAEYFDLESSPEVL